MHKKMSVANRGYFPLHLISQHKIERDTDMNVILHSKSGHITASPDNYE